MNISVPKYAYQNGKKKKWHLLNRESTYMTVCNYISHYTLDGDNPNASRKEIKDLSKNEICKNCFKAFVIE